MQRLPLATLVRRFARNPFTDHDLKVFDLRGARPHILRPTSRTTSCTLTARSTVAKTVNERREAMLTLHNWRARTEVVCLFGVEVLP